jgi:RNA polymerase sigma-70 factor (ECF subfamily)
LRIEAVHSLNCQEKVVTENFENIVNTYSKQVLNTAVRILGDWQKALDVHQEVFLAIWQRWHSYNGQTNWSGYLYRTTVRKAIELAKKSRKEITMENLPEKPSKEMPQRQLEEAELHKKITQALPKLPPRQADVFVMAKIEGLKTEQIAQVLQCSPATVRVHLHRAIKTLAAELGDYLKK